MFFVLLNIMCSNRCANPERPGGIVLAADPVPDLHAHRRARVVLERHDAQAVGKHPLAEFERRNLDGRRRGVRDPDRKQGDHDEVKHQKRRARGAGPYPSEIFPV